MAALVKGETHFMVSSTRQAFAGILLIFAIAVSAHAQTKPAKDLNATIGGKITLKGKGTAGIVVTLRKSGEPYGPTTADYRATTNDDGEYRITDVRAGSYQILTFAPAFVSSGDRYGQDLIVNKGETIEHLDFTLVRGGVITGKVVDAEGRPVIEESVTAIPLQETSRRPFFNSASVMTDDRGVYRIFGLPANTYRVAAARDDSNSFPGRIRDAYKRTYYPAAADIAQATTIDVSEGSETTNIDITLSRQVTTYTATGRIVEAATGQPLPNINYGVTHFIDPNSTSSWTNASGSNTNARGEFKIDGLTPGKYQISIVADKDKNWRAEPMRFEVVDQDVSNLLVKAARGNIISGVLVLEGTDDKTVREQFKQAVVSASVAGGSDFLWSGQSGISPDGSFWITGLRSGVVTFYLPNHDRFRIVRVEQNGVILPGNIELKDGQPLDNIRIVVQYANASLHGVIEFDNGPLPKNSNVSVMLRRLGDEDENRVRINEPTARVDLRGQFIIEGLVPGNYVLFVNVYVPGSPPKFISKKQDVVVIAGEANSVNVKIDLTADTKKP